MTKGGLAFGPARFFSFCRKHQGGCQGTAVCHNGALSIISLCLASIKTGAIIEFRRMRGCAVGQGRNGRAGLKIRPDDDRTITGMI